MIGNYGTSIKGKIMIKSYISLDLETTGLNPKLDKIIEIGAVKVIDGKIVDTFSSFVNPGRALTEEIKSLTGIVETDLRHAPTISAIVADLLLFLEDLPLVGHRILFDYSFVKKAATNHNLPFEKKGIDTLKIARKYLRALESKKLTFLCEYYEIPHKAHRALEDASATSILYNKLADNYYHEEDFSPRPLLYKVKKEGPISKRQIERLEKLMRSLELEPEIDVAMMTKNEASRYIDRILAKRGGSHSLSS